MDLNNGQVLKFLTAVLLLGVAFSQDYDYPTYSEDNLPKTSFSCKDKRNGGYYADIETDCQMYHVCSKDKFGFMRSTRFLCSNGTVFDQRHLVCEDYKRVHKCEDSLKYYNNAARIREILEARFRPEERNQEDYDHHAHLYDNLPKTSFSCEDKRDGGYYADIETDCQMYHVCSKDKFGFMRSTRFLCGNRTVFDQRHLICQDYRRVQNCKDSPKYYNNAARMRELNEARFRPEKIDPEIFKTDVEFDSERDYDYSPYPEIILPETSFSCEDKTNGGYYADIETDCQMYHVCSKDKFGVLKSTRFLCGNGTVFDQRHLVCQDTNKVQKCADSPRYYRNAASALEFLEARRRTAKRDQEIMKARQFDSGRLK